jgi:hypothetical protein
MKRQIRIQKVDGEITVYIENNNDEWVKLEDIYGFVGDYDLFLSLNAERPL